MNTEDNQPKASGPHPSWGILILSCCLSFALANYLKMSRQSGGSRSVQEVSQSEMSSQAAEPTQSVADVDSVDRELKSLDRAERLYKTNRQYEIEFPSSTPPPPGFPILDQLSFENLDDPQRQNQLQLQLNQLLGEHRSVVKKRQLPPDELITLEIDREKYTKDFEVMQRKHYLSEFVRNLRAAGYEVLINKDYEVVGLRRIPQRVLTGRELGL